MLFPITKISFLLSFCLGPVTLLHISPAAGCFSHQTVHCKWAIFSIILTFTNNFKYLILPFLSDMLRKRVLTVNVIGQQEHSHGYLTWLCSIIKYFLAEKRLLPFLFPPSFLKRSTF